MIIPPLAGTIAMEAITKNVGVRWLEGLTCVCQQPMVPGTAVVSPGLPEE